MPSILNTTDENFIKDFDSLLLTKREADQDVDDIVSKIRSRGKIKCSN